MWSRSRVAITQCVSWLVQGIVHLRNAVRSISMASVARNARSKRTISDEAAIIE